MRLLILAMGVAAALLCLLIILLEGVIKLLAVPAVFLFGLAMLACTKVAAPFRR
jgi:hypothetical protein